MADLETKLALEADKKGLTGEEKEAYIYGTIAAIKRGQGSKGSPHNRKQERKREAKEASDHWKKYHREDDTRLKERANRAYRSLNQKQRQEAIAHARRKGWTTNYATMDRRQAEKWTDYLESIK